MALTTLYLVRHGKTAWNAQKRWQGHMDVPLEESGIQQARRLADYLRRHSLAAVYSSDLQRARLTAEIIAAPHGLPVQQDIRWREMHIGILQGLTHDEIVSQHADEFQQLSENWFDHEIQGGESRRQMQGRIITALQEMQAQTEGSALVVSHGGTIRVLLRTLFPEHEGARHAPIENTSLTTLRLTDAGWELVGLSETPHLQPHIIEGDQEAQ